MLDQPAQPPGYEHLLEGANEERLTLFIFSNLQYTVCDIILYVLYDNHVYLNLLSHKHIVSYIYI